MFSLEVYMFLLGRINVYFVRACAGRHPHFQSICESGEKLRSEGHLASKAIGHRLTQLQDKWKKLSDMAATRKTRLEEAAQSQQVKKVDARGRGYERKTLAREEVKGPCGSMRDGLKGR